MGSIDIIKLLSTALSSAVNKSEQHQEKNSWEYRVSNPGLLGEKQEHQNAASVPCNPPLHETVFGQVSAIYLGQVRKLLFCCGERRPELVS